MSDHHDEPNNESRTGKPLTILCGLAIFACMTFLLSAFNPMKNVDPESLPSAHTWVWWTAKEYLEQKQAPDVVVVGPSLLMHPLARQDADYLNKEFDYVHHHQSQYLADTLSQSLGDAGKLSCFNFALPGALLSDDYLVVHGLLKGTRQPKVVVLGLGLRDFNDCLVNCPAATPPFKYLKRFSNIDDVVDLAMPQVWQRIDYWLGKAIYAHGRKLDIQVALTQLVKNGTANWCKESFPPCRLAEADPSRNMPGNMRSEVEEGMYMLRPHMPAEFEDNTREYQRRYRHANESLYKIQSAFLDKIMKDCHERNIRVLLVSLPVTEGNRKLMPAGYFDRYRQLMSATANKWNEKFVDMAADSEFVPTDFYDPVHMNASGGKRFCDKVANALSQRQDVVAAFAAKTRSQLAGKTEHQL